MADRAISQLAAVAGLSGTEMVPVVQAGATRKATVAQLRAGAGPGQAQTDDPVAAGQPLCVTAAGHVALGSAGSVAGARIAGLATAAAAPGFLASYGATGHRLSLADWSAVTGTALLAPGTDYFLGATAGTLTPTPPAVPGQVLVRLGRAITPTDLAIEVGPPIRL